MRKKRANKQTIDEVRGRRPATLGSGGGNGGGATEDRGGRWRGKRHVVLLSEVVDQVVEAVRRRRDPVGGAREEREPIGCGAAHDYAVDRVLELAKQRIWGRRWVGGGAWRWNGFGGLGSESEEARACGETRELEVLAVLRYGREWPCHDHTLFLYLSVFLSVFFFLSLEPSPPL